MTLSRTGDWTRLLVEDEIDAFNARALKEAPQLENADLRTLDLRRALLQRANLRDAYLRHADLRGLDLSEADLAGASLRDARISGCLFPVNVQAAEIALSLTHGIRLRTNGSLATTSPA